MAISRSACSVLVGMPVLGPARWTFRTTSGNSVMTAKPSDSDFNDKPGPLVPVMPTAPANEAPIAAQQAAISSSAWITRTSNSLCLASSCSTSLAGVIG